LCRRTRAQGGPKNPEPLNLFDMLDFDEDWAVWIRGDGRAAVLAVAFSPDQQKLNALASLPGASDTYGFAQSLMNARRSALIVSACVVGMPCGKSL
jgi:hypothetical protein